jgi:hypothetical protein
MVRKLHIAGFFLSSLTIATVALAQQGGGGGQGGGGQGGGDAGGSDDSVVALRLQDHEQARLSRAVSLRGAGSDCMGHACNEQPRRRPPERSEAQLVDNCNGDLRVARDRNGRVIRRVCEIF